MKVKKDGPYESKRTMVAMKVKNDGRYESKNDGRYESKKQWSL